MIDTRQLWAVDQSMGPGGCAGGSLTSKNFLCLIFRAANQLSIPAAQMARDKVVRVLGVSHVSTQHPQGERHAYKIGHNYAKVLLPVTSRIKI
jgi:hypothetical protein